MKEYDADKSDNATAAHAAECWYAVCCKPRHEGVAEENLLRQGYHTYLPRICHTYRRKGQWVNRAEPLFPRYLFIRVDLTQRSVAPVRFTRGVSGLVRHCGLPAVVPEQVVEAIMLRADANSGLHRDDRPLFCKGDQIRLVGGPLVGMEGIFAEEDSEKRVVVFLELLGKANKVRVKQDWVTPIV